MFKLLFIFIIVINLHGHTQLDKSALLNNTQTPHFPSLGSKRLATELPDRTIRTRNRRTTIGTILTFWIVIALCRSIPPGRTW